MSQQRASTELERAGDQLDQFAWLLDECFRIPGLNWRFGLEALIGLIPGAGDVVGGVLSLFLLVRAFQFKLPKIVIVRMILNNLLDLMVGSIPFLGDAFDFFWKSNTRNMKLFHEYAGEPQKSTGKHWLFIGLLISGFLAAFAAIFVALLLLLLWFFKHPLGVPHGMK